jgi:hypothetical protein
LGYRNYRGRSRRVARDPNRSGDYRVLTIHHSGSEDKDDLGWNEYLVVSNSGRFATGKGGVEWEYINVHHSGRDITKARQVMKRLSGEGE